MAGKPKIGTGPELQEGGVELKARIKYAGINTSENARRLSEMIAQARRSLQEDKDSEKGVFIETAEKQESQFLAEGFKQA